MKLYDLPPSPNCLKARAVVYELGSDVEIIPVNYREGEHKTPAFLAKNPNGKLPVLEENGFFLWESNAIITYLAALKPQSGLVPLEPQARADVDRWLFWQNSALAEAVGNLAGEFIFKPRRGQKADQNTVETYSKQFHELARCLNHALEGKETISGSLTVADFALASSVYLYPQLGQDISDYPHLQNWLNLIQGRESWQKALSTGK